jgi:prepilin-type N-terminal cleavage/methylation domain-containing protein
MRSSPPAEAPSGFTLLELVVVLFVAAILASALAVPAEAQLQAMRAQEARRQLDEWRDTLLGFAASHGRLPCPATEASGGEEAFAPGGDALNGQCADFHGGFLPAASLGLAPLDASGFARDPWATQANRVRYAVHSGAINGVARALTRVNGMQQATLAALGDAPAYLFVCASGETAGPSGCGPAANQLTRRAAFVLLSLGPNAPMPPAPASDEARNLDGDASFVSHERRADGFDDLVHWASIHLLAHRMVAAGRLP